jgi:hypothetical protein
LKLGGPPAFGADSALIVIGKVSGPIDKVSLARPHSVWLGNESGMPICCSDNRIMDIMKIILALASLLVLSPIVRADVVVVRHHQAYVTHEHYYYRHHYHHYHQVVIVEHN